MPHVLPSLKFLILPDKQTGKDKNPDLKIQLLKLKNKNFMYNFRQFLHSSSSKEADAIFQNSSV